MVIAPVVFFSIISCVVQFTDLSEMGRIGGKVLAYYLLTTMTAMAVGLGAFHLFQPGGAVEMGQLADTSSITSQTMNVSILDTIVGIVPPNFIRPFLESGMLQLIFMAVLFGIAVGMIGKYSEMLRSFFEACNELFLKVTTLIIKVMPVAIFCSITSTILKTGLETLVSVLTIFETYLFALACMIGVYSLLLLLKGRLSPIPLLRKYAPTMLQVFSMSSSNASIPINMEFCEKKLGIGRKVYSLSIPLGATINMDGTCINLAVFSLAIAKAYGVEITGSAIFSLVITIFVLSMGAPGIDMVKYKAT